MIETAHRFGWWAVHFPTSTVGAKGSFRTAYLGDGKGFPDIVAIKASRLLFAELKVGRNTTTAEQDEWAQKLLLTGVEMYLWTPDDVREIDQVLGSSACHWG